jgi:alpha-L-arabinofuranosidase
MDAQIRILPDEAIGTISPLLHGHFAEHLGRCCYDGLWTRDGAVRPQVVAALKRIGVPLLRWPGGCFADLYHWRDGIGPADQRTQRYAESCGERVLDTNAVGTHEFIALCRAIGAEPYLAGNVGSGTPEELCDWVDYCNGTLDTKLARQRTANGHAAPMNVKYWGIGNESWGCGGNYDPVQYAHEYRRYATMVKRTDPSVELVAVGDNRNRRDWNLRVMETLRDHLGLIQHLSIHRYWSAGPALDPSDAAYYNLQYGPQHVDGDIREARRVIDYFTGSARGPQSVGIAFDEWGVWHANARIDKRYEAVSTWRDALAAAATLDVFHSHCDAVTMANLAQIVNVLQPLVQTDGDSVHVTPTGDVFALYAAHRGATALRLAVESCPQREMPASRAEPAWSTTYPSGQLPYLSASASRGASGTTLTITNRHRTDALAVMVRGLPPGAAAQRQLSAGSTEAVATATLRRDIASASGELVLELPPATVTAIQVA